MADELPEMPKKRSSALQMLVCRSQTGMAIVLGDGRDKQRLREPEMRLGPHKGGWLLKVPH